LDGGRRRLCLEEEQVVSRRRGFANTPPPEEEDHHFVETPRGFWGVVVWRHDMTTSLFSGVMMQERENVKTLVSCPLL